MDHADENTQTASTSSEIIPPSHNYPVIEFDPPTDDSLVGQTQLTARPGIKGKSYSEPKRGPSSSL